VADRLDESGDVVRVAGDDLDEAVLAGHEHLFIDAASVRLAEIVFAPLGEEALGAAEVLVEFLLVLVARRRAVDDHGGPLEGLLRLEAHLMAQFLELRADVVVHRQMRAALDQVVELGPIGRERRPLVEGDFIDSHALTEVGEETEQGLADRARAHDVDDLFHDSLSKAVSG
jgi:hypothetical protein